MPISLSDWDVTTGRHLRMISEGCNVIKRHVDGLMACEPPGFETLSHDDLAMTEERVERLLAWIRRLRRDFEEHCNGH